MTKKLLTLIGGAGLASEIILAPDNESRTVKKLMGKGEKLVDGVKKSAKEEVSSATKNIRAKTEAMKRAIRPRAKAAVKATLVAEESAHKKVNGAIRSAGKAVGVEEKKITSRNGVANKMPERRPHS